RALAFAGRGRSLVAAEVVSDGGASGWTGELRIDRGRRDGIEAGAPVIAPEGFVGRVVSVSERTAKVLPATDPNCRLSCVVEGLEKAGHGILSGGGNARPAPEIAMLHVVEPLEVAFIDKDIPVKPGARVFTAGDGTAYPRGILVGTVIGVDRDSTLLFQRARVRPAVPFHALGPVFVLKRGDSGPASGGGARGGGE
ncbi:MAG: rod shape-determining protein MreC, partial [Kiritimatiellae bacterium]|nr:rod shape-determining protein MreC [Kiritimatiellia bacterium]